MITEPDRTKKTEPLTKKIELENKTALGVFRSFKSVKKEKKKVPTLNLFSSLLPQFPRRNQKSNPSNVHSLPLPLPLRLSPRRIGNSDDTIQHSQNSVFTAVVQSHSSAPSYTSSTEHPPESLPCQEIESRRRLASSASPRPPPFSSSFPGPRVTDPTRKTESEHRRGSSWWWSLRVSKRTGFGSNESSVRESSDPTSFSSRVGSHEWCSLLFATSGLASSSVTFRLFMCCKRLAYHYHFALLSLFHICSKLLECVFALWCWFRS